MLEFIKYIFSRLEIFIGFLVLIGVLSEGLARIIRAFRRTWKGN